MRTGLGHRTAGFLGEKTVKYVQAVLRPSPRK